MMTIEEVNALPLPDFLARFGDVAEHSPWVAREAAQFRPFASREQMIARFESAVRAANREAQLSLLCCHPDLATRARLTDESAREQAGAGLDCLDAAEFARFTALNTRYRESFGFPFIYAVKGATKHMILDSFETRCGNDPQTEFQAAISQVCRIFRFRIEDRVAP